MLFGRFGLLLLLASTLFAQQAPAPLGQGLNLYSQEKEARLGQDLAERIRQQTTPVSDAAVQDYVRALGAKLATKMPASILTYDYKYTVVAELPDQCDNATHEPLSLPGGYIFVPASLVRSTHNEAELAGAFAHAMVHVAARHGSRMASKDELASRLGTQPSLIPVIFVGGPCGLGAGAGKVQPAVMLKFRRDYELEADRVAAGVMARAGYNPAALVAYIERLQPETLGGLAISSPLPARSTRVQAIERAVRELPAASYSSNDSELKAIQKLIAR